MLLVNINKTNPTVNLGNGELAGHLKKVDVNFGFFNAS